MFASVSMKLDDRVDLRLSGFIGSPIVRVFGAMSRERLLSHRTVRS